MGKTTKFVDTIRTVFEEEASENNSNVRLWAAFVWLFISFEVGYYSGFLIPEKYRLIMTLTTMVLLGIALFKPMVKLSVKKPSKTEK